MKRWYKQPIKYCGCCGYATIYLKQDKDWCGYCKRHPVGETCKTLWDEELGDLGFYEECPPHEIDPNGKPLT